MRLERWVAELVVRGEVSVTVTPKEGEDASKVAAVEAFANWQLQRAAREALGLEEP